jgi:hypothetical protein
LEIIGLIDNDEKNDWLNVVERMSVAASVVGIIATLLTKQAMLTTTPLVLALVLNIINRQRQLIKVHQVLEDYSLTNNFLISNYTEYRCYKLEIEQQIKSLKKVQEMQKLSLDQINNDWQNKVISIHHKLSTLENNRRNNNIDSCSSYLSINERLNILENMIKQYQQDLSNTQEKPLEVESFYYNVSTNNKLNELDLEFIHTTAAYLENMAEKILHYHQDHGASLEEAKIIAKYYLQLSDQVKSVNNQQNLKELIQSAEILKKQVSRYKHEDSKYNWSKELERYVLDKLKTIKLN